MAFPSLARPSREVYMELPYQVLEDQEDFGKQHLSSEGEDG